jgi:hypothetical protein
MDKLIIGVYDPNAPNEISYHYVDEYNLVLTYKENRGRGDSIGRTMKTYFIYDDPDLVEGIASLWQFRPEFKNRMVGIRHPDIGEEVGKDKINKSYWVNRMSRDHYVNTLIALRIWEKRNGMRHPKLEEIVKATPFKIRRMARWTLSVILWSKSLLDKKWALWLYLIWEIFQVNVIYRPIRWLGYKLTGWYPEVDQDEWGWTSDIDPNKQNEEWRKNHLIQAQPKWKQRISKIVFPAYALGFSAFQLYVTEDSFPKLKKKLQKSMLKMAGETNYVHHMLLGKKDVPRDKVEAYKAMSGGRWSGHLNDRNDRNMKVFPEGRCTANVLDVDLVRYLYNETQIN